jgi:hypothetical protein
MQAYYLRPDWELAKTPYRSPAKALVPVRVNNTYPERPMIESCSIRCITAIQSRCY